MGGSLALIGAKDVLDATKDAMSGGNNNTTTKKDEKTTTTTNTWTTKKTTPDPAGTGPFAS